jgi:uncharacterized protein YaiL (DUF2058 family)
MTDARYNNGKIYKLVSNHTDKIYIGSTIQNLSSRMTGHRSKYKRYLNGKGYNFTANELVCFPDCKIYLLENVNCNSKHELEMRERFHIESCDCVNKNIPCRTEDEKKEYIDKIKEKNQIKQKDKIENKEQIKEAKNRMKKLINEHKKKIKEDNKYFNEVYCHICKSIVTKSYLKTHQKTKKCLSCVQ